MALDWLGDLLGLNKGKATIKAGEQNLDVLKGLDTEMSGLIDTGANEAGGYLKEILNLSGYTPGADPREAFRTSPGYDFALDQGLQALDRRASMSGRLSSGNADLDTLKYAHGLADNEFDDWLTRVSSGLGDLTTLSRDVTGQKLGLAGDIGSGELNVNNQVAAGKEAGQGAIWDLFNNVAGVAGSAFGLKPPGGLSPQPAMPGFGGYGRGY